MILYYSGSVMIRVWTFCTHKYSFGFVCDKCSENTNISETQVLAECLLAMLGYIKEIIMLVFLLKQLILLDM
jgi:hypothetical protein